MPPPVQSPRILIVDDDEGLLVLMAETLQSEGYDVVTAGSGKVALKRLEERTPDLMLLDLKMRNVDGPALLERLQHGSTPVPFIIVTGQGDEKVAVDVMKRGALDYVMKTTALLDLLPGVVKRTLEATGQKKALAAAQSEYRELEGQVLAMGERERYRIGADLHDGLGQQLTAIELMCAGLREDAAGEQPELAKGLERVSAMLREAVAQTRLLARGLVPVDRGPEALQTGLAELAERTHSLGQVRCSFECAEPVRISNPEVAGHLYRIAQEATNNALKHARATRISLRLARKGDRILLEISDDGIGLPKEAGDGKGLGLGVMQHRAHVIGAELTVKSKRGEGVTISCVLPSKS